MFIRDLTWMKNIRIHHAHGIIRIRMILCCLHTQPLKIFANRPHLSKVVSEPGHTDHWLYTYWNKLILSDANVVVSHQVLAE
jgi:hypothetical protein